MGRHNMNLKGISVRSISLKPRLLNSPMLTIKAWQQARKPNASVIWGDAKRTDIQTQEEISRRELRCLDQPEQVRSPQRFCLVEVSLKPQGTNLFMMGG